MRTAFVGLSILSLCAFVGCGNGAKPGKAEAETRTAAPTVKANLKTPRAAVTYKETVLVPWALEVGQKGVFLGSEGEPVSDGNDYWYGIDKTLSDNEVLIKSGRWVGDVEGAPGEVRWRFIVHMDAKGLAVNSPIILINKQWTVTGTKKIDENTYFVLMGAESTATQSQNSTLARITNNNSSSNTAGHQLKNPSVGSFQSGAKTVHVSGYWKKNGTYVRPYNRRPPRR